MSYKFVPTDPESITRTMIAEYENLTGHTVRPADPERLFIAWIAGIISQERVYQNYSGNQNIPSRAEGENLDALGQWIYGLARKEAQAAKCVMQFRISAAQETAILIPSGTKVTDRRQNLIWETTASTLIPANSVTANVMVECQTPGKVGNDYAAGSICVLIDVDNIPFYDSCKNITESEGGADRESDADYFDLMQKSLNSFTTAGPSAAYEFWAKSVSDEIADVKAILPSTQHTDTLTVWAQGAEKAVFLGAENVIQDSITVKDGETELAKDTDYSVSVTDNGLIKITVTGEHTELTVIYDKIEAGHVDIYALMSDGEAAGETIKQLIASACNADDVRPMTDLVTVKDPAPVNYNIKITYYINQKSQSSVSDIANRVSEAVSDYAEWQSAVLGRDINPSELMARLMDAGIKRAVITEPEFSKLNDGSDGKTPQLAVIGTTEIINGGFEDE